MNRYRNWTERQLEEAVSKLSGKLGDIKMQARDKKRDLTDEEYGLVCEIEGEISELRSHLKKFEPANKPLSFVGISKGPASASKPSRPMAMGRDYRSMFGLTGQLDRGGFANLNDFLTVVSSGRFDPRLFRDSANETTPSSGGFAVPVEFAAWLLDASLESEVVRPRASVWPMRSDALKVPGWDSANHSASLYGGLTGTWLAEQAAASETYATMRQIELNAKKLACYTSASNELVADGIDYERQIQNALVKTVGWYMDDAFISGNGVGRPLGALNDPALIVVAKEVAQDPSTIIWLNCVKMFARMAPQCLGNAIWVANPTTIPQLLSMYVEAGVGGSTVQPAVLQQGDQFRLLGKPLIFSEKVPALGTEGQLMFMDWSQYCIGLRKEVSLDKSIHVGWTTDTAAYRAILRVDGQGTWNAAITPKSGDSLSWCVALAA